MQFEEALYRHLNNNTALKAIVKERIYPLILPQKCQLPAITYQKVSCERLHSLQGDTGYTTPIFQITSRCKTYSQCKMLAESLRLSIQNFTGLMGGTDGIDISAVLLTGEDEGYESDTDSWYILMDFKFHYEERM